MDETLANNGNEYPAITELMARQRRVLGVLVEKAFTTPEYYPLTLKAAVTGCNQKSNRSPVCHYSEDDVLDVLEDLRQLGLVAVVHTQAGRTERYRHYMRRRFTFTDPQLAILTELMLRGRQSIGELRARASRMVPIESLDQLREELQGLIAMELAQADAELERRGVLVDHALYTAREREKLQATQPRSVPPATRQQTEAVAAGPEPMAETPQAVSSKLAQRIVELQTAAERHRIEMQSLRDELTSLEETVRDLTDRLDSLCRDLGV